jgi:hypothetical protein
MVVLWERIGIISVFVSGYRRKEVDAAEVVPIGMA